MYISDSLNLLLNTFLSFATSGKADTIDMRYADIVDKTKYKEVKHETAEDIIDRLTKKLQGGKK